MSNVTSTVSSNRRQSRSRCSSRCSTSSSGSWVGDVTASLLKEQTTKTYNSADDNTNKAVVPSLLLTEKNFLSSVVSDSQLLSTKERQISDFLTAIAESIENNHNDGTGNSDSASVEADLVLKRLLLRTDKALQNLPLIFQHKWHGILKQYITRQFQLNSAKRFVTISVPPQDVCDYAKRYKLLMKTFFDDSDDVVSFKTTNKTLAGTMSLKDLFLLHFFAFATCNRVKHDLAFALAVTGASSVGKSLAFENPLLSSSYNYCSQIGAGRFKCDNVNLVLCHDVSLSVLVSSSDGELFRCLARGEIVKSKVHSGEQTLDPLFLFITSNSNVHRHTFSSQSPPLPPPPPPQQQQQPKQLLMPKVFPSQLVPPKNRKAQLDETYTAMKNRILELFFAGKPFVPQEAFPLAGTSFERHHLILGLFDRILNILVSVPTEKFVSHVLFAYCLNALFHNLDYFCHVFSFTHIEKDKILQDLQVCQQKYTHLIENLAPPKKTTIDKNVDDAAVFADDFTHVTLAHLSNNVAMNGVKPDNSSVDVINNDLTSYFSENGGIEDFLNYYSS